MQAKRQALDASTVAKAGKKAKTYVLRVRLIVTSRVVPKRCQNPA